jgi:hypothetical protein
MDDAQTCGKGLAERSKRVAVFAAFVTREEELLVLLQQFLERAQKLLAGMREA